MRKFIWTTLIIVSISVGLFATKGFGAYAQPPMRTGNSVVTLINSAQDVGAVDLYIDHQLVKANVSPTDLAVSIEVAPGNHLLDVFPAGQNIILIKTTELAVVADQTYHFSLAGREADWSVALVSADEMTEAVSFAAK